MLARPEQDRSGADRAGHRPAGAGTAPAWAGLHTIVAGLSAGQPGGSWPCHLDRLPRREAIRRLADGQAGAREQAPSC